MTGRQQATYQRILSAQRQQIQYEIDVWRERSAVDCEGDVMDQLRAAEDREFALRNVTRLSGLLRSVERALEQLRDGTYGLCAGCECEIPIRRLQAVPWSTLCITCQEMAETAGFALAEPAEAARSESRLS